MEIISMHTLAAVDVFKQISHRLCGFIFVGEGKEDKFEMKCQRGVTLYVK